jgi:Uma2 family endonuclease
MAVVHTDIVSEEEYRRLALDDSHGQWELYRGQLREKPWMSARHDYATTFLTELLLRQLDRRESTLSIGLARLRVASDTYYIPDIVVIPASLARTLRAEPNALSTYAEALPLVIEGWSPSTGSYDASVKLADYQRRGDLEIWFVHPGEGTLQARRRLANGSYHETVYRGGIVNSAALPEVAIDLDEFAASM